MVNRTKKKDIKNKSTIIMFTDDSGKVNVEVFLDEENKTVWMTLNQIASLFSLTKQNISLHIANILKENDNLRSTVKQNLTVQIEGGRKITREIKFFNLDMILIIGYRVNSKRGIQFRAWANKILNEYIIKGYALNDELLKNNGNNSYFQELLDRIRDIRSSEKNLYSKLLEIYATSIDYDPKNESSIKFFKVVQNKLHYAISGKTAAEIIYERANSKEPFMGLTTFKNSKPVRKEIVIAKNYLNEPELRKLNLLVSTFLNHAEMLAFEKTPMYMNDWVKELNNVIKLSKKEVLDSNGNISHEQATNKAINEYSKYSILDNNQLSKAEKDFLEHIKELQKIEKGGNK